MASQKDDIKEVFVNLKDDERDVLLYFSLLFSLSMRNVVEKSGVVRKFSDALLGHFIKKNEDKKEFKAILQYLEKNWAMGKLKSYDRKKLMKLLFSYHRKVKSSLMKNPSGKDLLKISRRFIFQVKNEDIEIEFLLPELIDWLENVKERGIGLRKMYVYLKPSLIMIRNLITDGDVIVKAAIGKEEDVRKEFLPDDIKREDAWEIYWRETGNRSNFLSVVFWWYAWFTRGASEASLKPKEYLKKYGVDEKHLKWASYGKVFIEFAKGKVMKRLHSPTAELVEKLYSDIAPPLALNKDTLLFIKDLGIYSDEPKKLYELAGVYRRKALPTKDVLRAVSLRDLKSNAFVREIFNIDDMSVLFDLAEHGSDKLHVLLEMNAFKNDIIFNETAVAIAAHLVRTDMEKVIDFLKKAKAAGMRLEKLINLLMSYPNMNGLRERLVEAGVLLSKKTDLRDRILNLNWDSKNVHISLGELVEEGAFSNIQSLDEIFPESNKELRKIRSKFLNVINKLRDKHLYYFSASFLMSVLEEQRKVGFVRFRMFGDRGVYIVTRRLWTDSTPAIQDRYLKLLTGIFREEKFNLLKEMFLTTGMLDKIFGKRFPFRKFISIPDVHLVHEEEGVTIHTVVNIDKSFMKFMGRFRMFVKRMKDEDSKTLLIPWLEIDFSIDESLDPKDVLETLNAFSVAAFGSGRTEEMYAFAYRKAKGMVEKDIEKFAGSSDAFRRMYFNNVVDADVHDNLKMYYPKAFREYVRIVEMICESGMFDVSLKNEKSYFPVTIRTVLPEEMKKVVEKWDSLVNVVKTEIIGSAFEQCSKYLLEGSLTVKDVSKVLKPLLSKLDLEDVDDIIRADYFRRVAEKYIESHTFFDEIGFSQEQKSRIASLFASNIIFIKMLEGIPEKDNAVIPLPKFVDKKLLTDALLYNEYKFDLSKYPMKPEESIKEYLDRLEKEDIKPKEKVPPPKVEEIEMTEQEKEDFSADLLQYYNVNHMKTGLKVLRRFKFTGKKGPLFPKYVKAGSYKKMRFHGTSSLAAAMILRFGFADSNRANTPPPVNIIGNMLARTCVYYTPKGKVDWRVLPSFRKKWLENATTRRKYKFRKKNNAGTYSALVITKAGQYARSRRSYAEIGDRGYIFIMEAAYGALNWDYKVAGLPSQNDGILTPEWAVYDPNEQYYIKEVLFVEHVHRGKIIDWARKYDKDVQEIPDYLWENKGSGFKFFSNWVFHTDKVALPDGSVVGVSEAMDFYASEGAFLRSGPNDSWVVSFMVNDERVPETTFIKSAYEFVRNDDVFGKFKKAWEKYRVDG